MASTASGRGFATRLIGGVPACSGLSYSNQSPSTQRSASIVVSALRCVFRPTRPGPSRFRACGASQRASILPHPALSWGLAANFSSCALLSPVSWFRVVEGGPPQRRAPTSPYTSGVPKTQSADNPPFPAHVLPKGDSQEAVNSGLRDPFVPKERRSATILSWERAEIGPSCGMQALRSLIA